ncbi:hydroxyacylglutathione hydrolase-like protein isoform X2 [Perognathus longimembris pacificus]|uniref:hydroxyacylglutathione hydrolase-like protein isoform X2 n=1 Tax=Perognathus longimembris pacificus TaxID=214514 RepID=UPI0020196317|nr:hydroxyacylglutathione hydrolase-like protein isoform X2 [Perognathus longimembris pacificus]
MPVSAFAGLPEAGHTGHVGREGQPIQLPVTGTPSFQLLEIVSREGVSLTTVLTTHHHWDHARGNAELARLQPGLAVMGADERICALTRRLAHGEELLFGAIHMRCLLTPGHTSGHMSYFLWEDESPDPPALFSGDALSVAGCGWRLEGTAQQMYQSLADILGNLPPQTKVFCGHEHTLSNLEFAQKVEPCNDHVRAKLSWAQKRDEDDMPTVPSTLGEELLYNPFLRVHQTSDSPACLPSQGGVHTSVHRPDSPGLGPRGALQGAGKVPACFRATAASGQGPPGSAVGPSEHTPAEVSPKGTPCLQDPPIPLLGDNTLSLQGWPQDFQALPGWLLSPAGLGGSQDLGGSQPRRLTVRVQLGLHVQIQPACRGSVL